MVCIVVVCASGLRLWDAFLLFARERILLRFKNFLFAMESLLQQRGFISRVADSGARLVPAATPFARAPRNASLSVHLKRNVDMSLECVRFMGIGSWKEGNRAGQQGVRYLQATLDGISSENPESDAREQFLEQAKAESASTIDEEQEPFRDAVESGQTIGEATTDLQFGAIDGKSADEAIIHSSKEQSKTNGKSEPTKEEDAEHEKEEISSEVWGSKDEAGSTHAFIDDSRKVNFHGENEESVLGIGGQRADESQM